MAIPGTLASIAKVFAMEVGAQRMRRIPPPQPKKKPPFRATISKKVRIWLVFTPLPEPILRPNAESIINGIIFEEQCAIVLFFRTLLESKILSYNRIYDHIG